MAHVLKQGAQGLFKVTDFDTNRKSVYDFLLNLNSKLGPIVLRFRDIRAFVQQAAFSISHPLFRPKLRGVPLGVDL